MITDVQAALDTIVGAFARYHRAEPHEEIAAGSTHVGELVDPVVEWARDNAR